MKTNSKVSKRIISLVLTVLLVLSMVPMSVFSAFAEEVSELTEGLAELSATIDTGAEVTLSDADGDGYYDISTADELYAFAALVNGGNLGLNAELTADIVVNEGTMSAETEGAREWTPIGNYNNNEYTGTFDGNDHTVSGLYFNNSEVKYVGLFGCVGENGTVKNTGVINSYFNGDWYVGGVVGLNYGTIENCYNTGKVSGSNSVGGVVGYNDKGTIENCYNMGEVKGITFFGGVVGLNFYGTIEDCYNTGKVSGSGSCVGGVAGYNVLGTITNCYNTGTVSGSGSYVGGVVGENYSGTITNCYNAGEVSGSGSYVGGVAGYSSYGTITNCYNTGEVSGSKCIGGVAGYNEATITNCYYLDTACIGGINGEDVAGSAEAKTAGQFASGEVAYLLQGQQTEEIWGQKIGTDQLPILGGDKVYYGYITCDEADNTIAYTNTVTSEEAKPDHNFENGFCTVCGGYEPATQNEDGVYEIGNAGQLYWFADKVNNDYENFGSANAILTADIVVNEGTMTAETTGARKWTPIGNLSRNYTGTFNGNDHTVSGLYFNNKGTNFVGLFGCVGENGTVKNTGVINSYFNGYSDVGSVVGINIGTIENCYNAGEVSGDYGVGGVVGVHGGTITNCYNTGEVSGSNCVGGVAGSNEYGTITNCYNEGTVSGSEWVGGVAGENFYGTIENCYNTGEVSGSEDVGGVVGYNDNGTITNCYNTGEVSGSKRVGGVFGSESSGTFTNCYYLDIGTDYESGTTTKTIEQFASGEVTYLLGEAFGQKIGTDQLPVLGGDKVYYGYLACADDATLVYTNNANATTEKPDHTWEDGKCTACEKDCEHDWYYGTCDICGKECSHPEHTLEMEVYPEGDDLYYVNAEAYCSTCGDYLFYYSDYAEVVSKEEAKDCLNNGSVTLSFTCEDYDGNLYPVTKTVEVESDNHAGPVENGFCSACGGYESAKYNEETGAYEIANAGQLYWFAEQVNVYNNNSISAMLVADIVVNEDMSAESLIEWTPIGSSSIVYCGAFDGQGYTVSGLYCKADEDYVGFFGHTDYNYPISNLGVKDSYFEGNSYVGAFAGYASSSISNCFVDNVEVVCNGNSGADFVGYNFGEISNSYSTSDSFVENSYYGTITNCYYLSDTDDGNGGKTAEQFASGEVAYLLQAGVAEEDIYDDEWNYIETIIPEIWGQTIGTDTYPVFGGEKVYAVTNCKGEVAGYSNTEGETLDHNFENGFCAVCGVFEPATLNEDGVYEIGNAGQLYWFADKVNNDNENFGSANAILTADIVVNEGTMTAESEGAREWTPIGNYDNRYTGTFNGNDHTVSGLYFNNSEADYVGLFGSVVENGTVKNTGVINSYFNGDWYVGGVVGLNYGTIENCYNTGKVSGSNSVGGVVGYNDKGTIENCYNTGEVSGSSYSVGGVVGLNFYGTIEDCYNTGKVSGSSYSVGGVAGYNVLGTITNCYNEGTVSGSNRVGGVVGENYSGTITNCYNAGEVSGSGSYVGGVAGYSSYGTITNCYNTGEVSGSKCIGGVAGYNEATITNCYYLDTACIGGINGEDVAGSAEAKTAEQFASGEVAYLLGEAFGQKLGTDELPILGGGKVYAVTKCNGELVGFSNTEGKVEHFTFDENGFCTVCGAFEPATLNEDGVYEIGNAGQLYWFADKVNNDNENFGSADAILTADIVVNEGVITKYSTNARAWTPIGNDDNKYTGTFNGNDHTVSGLYFNNNATNYVGLFGYVGTNGTVKNTGVINSYFNGYFFVSGVVGWNDFGTITNCYNTGEVSGNLAVGGVAGSNNSNGTITNCYNTGEVSGNLDVGGVVGYNYGTITNCYNTGEVSGNFWYIGGVAGDNYEGTIENCYNTGDVSGSEDVGGVVGVNDGTITNCYNTGEVSGNERVGGVVGKNNEGTITNCYYLDTAFGGGIDGEDIEGSAEAKTSEQFASGEVAYLLGEAFGQKLGTDQLPILGGDKVYAVTNCKGEAVSYNNTKSETLDHNFENGFCTICGAMDGIAQVKGYSISLGGNIAVNYYMVLSDEVLADANAEMVFTVPNGGSTYEVRIPVSSVTPDSNGYYMFTCEVAAKEMASKIAAQIVTSDSESDVFEYTVKQYAEYILANPDTYANEQELVKAMLNYGANAQCYFNYNTDNLANATLDEAEKALVDNLDLSAYNVSVNGSEEGVAFYGGALSLKSETAIKLYFVIEEGTTIPEVTVNGEKAELTKNGNLYELKISDIPAHMLDEMFEVKVGNLTVNYGAFSYGYAAMNSGKAALVNTIKALYAYNQKAIEYLG